MGRPGHVHRRGAQVPASSASRSSSSARSGSRSSCCRSRSRRPTHEAQVFLTTQISDEAKHIVFWNASTARSSASSAGEPRRDARQAALRGERGLGDALRRHPPRVRRGPAQGPERLRRAGPRDHRLHDRDRGHARPHRRPLHDQVACKERDWFPGFTAGFTAVNRDESRHVGFGVKFLADAIKDDPANAKIIEDTLKETPAGRARSSSSRRGWTTRTTSRRPSTTRREIFEYAAKSLSKKLAAMGLDPAMLATA